MSLFEVASLTKTFPVKAKGIGGLQKIFPFLQKQRASLDALQEVSFSVEEGQIVGCIGMQGAGKSVLLKTLCGIIKPSGGSVRIDGIDPYENRHAIADKLAVVWDASMELSWNLPLQDTFAIYQKLYAIPNDTYQKNFTRLVEMLTLEAALALPVEQLTQTEKAKANIALSMLRAPEILLIDNPTFGLNAANKCIVREALHAIHHEMSTTIMFTTQDMDDIETIATKMLLLHEGMLLFEGKYELFATQYTAELMIVMDFSVVPRWKEDRRFTLARAEEGKWYVQVTPALSSREAFIELVRMYEPAGIALYEQNIEDILDKIFEEPLTQNML